MTTIEPRRAPQHLLGLGADRRCAPRESFVQRDHRGLVAHDTFILGVNQRVRGAQIGCFQLCNRPNLDISGGHRDLAS
jgi:hypothetical protein